MTDWSKWCAKPIRAIVQARACPLCGSKAGHPCRNMLFGLVDPKLRARKQRPFYQATVHKDRRREKLSPSEAQEIQAKAEFRQIVRAKMSEQPQPQQKPKRQRKRGAHG